MGFKLYLRERTLPVGNKSSDTVRAALAGGLRFAVMMAHVPQARLDENPRRPSHQYQHDEARERETGLEFFRALPPLRWGGAFGEAGGFLW